MKEQAAKNQSSENFDLLCKVLAIIPVKSEKLTPELSEFMKDGFSFIQKHYLDHPQLNSECSDAILNMTQLTYDNFLACENIRGYDRPFIKECLNSKTLEGIITDDMKMYALDIVFKKK